MMNTQIADFVSKRTDPYFFSTQEDANLTAIHTEVKRSIESATDEMTFDLDPLLMKQAEAALAAKGWTLEEATVFFSTGWLCVRRMQKRGMINLAIFRRFKQAVLDRISVWNNHIAWHSRNQEISLSDVRVLLIMN